jgi:hypothetical protein
LSHLPSCSPFSTRPQTTSFTSTHLVLLHPHSPPAYSYPFTQISTSMHPSSFSHQIHCSSFVHSSSN